MPAARRPVRPNQPTVHRPPPHRPHQHHTPPPHRPTAELTHHSPRLHPHQVPLHPDAERRVPQRQAQQHRRAVVPRRSVPSLQPSAQPPTTIAAPPDHRWTTQMSRWTVDRGPSEPADSPPATQPPSTQPPATQPPTIDHAPAEPPRATTHHYLHTNLPPRPDRPRPPLRPPGGKDSAAGEEFAVFKVGPGTVVWWRGVWTREVATYTTIFARLAGFYTIQF